MEAASSGGLEPTYPAFGSKAPNPSLGNDKKHCISSAPTKLLPHIIAVTVKNPLLNKDIQ